MKILVCTLTALALTSFAPCIAAAADLDEGYYEAPPVVEERIPVIERERIIERRYYEPYYAVEAPPVVVERYPRPYPYHADYYGWEPRDWDGE